MTARKLSVVVAVLCAALSARAEDFYANHLQRGIANYNRGNFAQAASDLRVAAFGLLESPADYETALLYQFLADTKLQRADDAKQLAEKLVTVERVVPVYAKLQLPAGMREQIEAELPKLVSAQQLARAPGFAHLAGRSTVVPAPRTPVPAPPAAVAPSPISGAQAMLLLQRGDDAGARAMAEKVTADDYTNALAQTVLAILAGRRSDWAGVVEHYSVVRTRRRLNADELNTYIMGLVRSGRSIDATGVERLRGAQPFVAKASAVAPAPAPAPPPVPPTTPAAQLADADRALREGRVVAARDAYRRLAATAALPRELSLAAARGLNQTAAYRDSSAVYQKLYPLHNGEELHMFYEAVNRYEMGDYAIAKKLLTRALPYIPQSRDVELYRGRIERTQ